MVKCPNCNHTSIESIYSLAKTPTNSMVLMSSKEKAINYQKGDIKLGFCKSCGFIYNYSYRQEKAPHNYFQCD